MMRFVCFNLLSASGTSESVVVGIGIADTDFCLQVPMTAKHESMAVGHTATNKPTLITGVLQFTEVRSKKIYIEIDASGIILSTMQIGSKVVSAKAIT